MSASFQNLFSDAHERMAEARERREQGKGNDRKRRQPFVSKQQNMKNEKFGFGGKKRVSAG